MARPQDGVENSAAFSRKDWPGSRPFWRGKRVLVTGGSGFLGRFIVGKLRERGAAEIIVPRSSRYALAPRLHCPGRGSHRLGRIASAPAG